MQLFTRENIDKIDEFLVICQLKFPYLLSIVIANVTPAAVSLLFICQIFLNVNLSFHFLLSKICAMWYR